MDGQWFRRFGGPEPDALRLIRFSRDGGAAGAYRPLSRRLRPHVEVRVFPAVTSPGNQRLDDVAEGGTARRPLGERRSGGQRRLP